MATVKELLTNVANNTRKFLGTEEELSLEEMSQGIGEASAESDFQTELIEEFSTILDRSVAPDAYANGKEDGYADALEKRTDLVVTANGEYTPPEGSTGFKSVSVNVQAKSVMDLYVEGTTKNVSGSATKVAAYVFQNNAVITNANFPNATSIGAYAFNNCKKLVDTNFQNATTINTYAFSGCTELLSIDLPKATSIGAYAFYGSYPIKTVILRSETVCTLGHYSNVFTNCYHITGAYSPTYNPNSEKDGYFYVPRALLSDDDITKDYRRATNWATYSTQFRALEDYTVDGTTTGALDPNKI